MDFSWGPFRPLRLAILAACRLFLLFYFIRMTLLIMAGLVVAVFLVNAIQVDNIDRATALIGSLWIYGKWLLILVGGALVCEALIQALIMK